VYNRSVSSYVLPVFYAILQLLILMAIGFLARRSGRFDEAFFTSLSRFLIRIVLPTYFIARVGKIDLSEVASLFVMPVAAVLVIAAGLGVSLLFFSFLSFTGPDRRAGIAISAFGNSGYIPLTLAEVLPLSVPIIADQIDWELPPILIAAYVFAFSPLLWSIGNYVLTKPGDRTIAFRPRDLISPPLIGILIGVLVSVTGVVREGPTAIEPLVQVFAALERLSAVTLPLALIVLGALIGGIKVSREELGVTMRMSIAVGAIRFIVLPGLFWGLYFLLRSRIVIAPALLLTLFLELHVPPATNLSLMAGQAQINEHHTGMILLVSYIAYLVIMPAYLLLYLAVSA
jgi:predicted permease